eukprot:CAMPEP_0117038184 /NCGR_PEP_ID=MMETSP0472-20121206/26888_1 /TAXON_ID=693140 ORGANISM="Tiarina fusus, Strain LIS" /NCGR_SAMPLE_ID=MMETSP0472 /ASSEMBLY_ACC=CAM_ASM_000603 /LENGTH=196 /DNA_ID=CAMNT_0004748347 /DNA_START=172 /DNA_END=762 /DNA_ORIENTATION=-
MQPQSLSCRRSAEEEEEEDFRVAMLRLTHDLVECQDRTLFGIAAAPINENIFEWSAVILGPKDTPWEGGRFQLILHFPDKYPFKPPKVQFTSPSIIHCHPNVGPRSGQVFADFLGADDDDKGNVISTWSPAWYVSSVLVGIQAILNNPNTEAFVNSNAAYLYDEDQPAYNRRVLRAVEESKTEIVPEHLHRMLKYD